MHDPSDLDLQKTEPPPAPRLPPRRSAVAWIAALAVVVAAGAAAYFYFQRGRGSTPAAAGVPESTAPAGPDRPLGGAAEPIEIPPLDASDEVVRKLVSALSSHPRVAAWLATDGLIRNFAVVVENIASGRTPASHLDTLRPQGGFRTTERDD